MVNLLTFSETELLLSGILSGLFLIQLLFLLVVYQRPYRKMKKRREVAESTIQPPVSVIVYAKNEAENLQANLPLLLSQNYPDYEVIVVNDSSTDDSEQVLKRLKAQHQHLHHTYIPKDARCLSRKKLALTVGIKAAKNEILLFTEANCKPLSASWVKTMAANFVDGKTITLGYCAYRHHGGFFHRLIAYDNLISGLQYLSAALFGSPYAGNGRNLAYLKDEFFSHKGFHKSLNLHAGDDDLFVNEVATGKNTRVDYSPESITEMGKVSRFSVWKEMKVSRAATRRFYKGWALSRYRFDTLLFFAFLLVLAALIYIGVIGNFLIAIFGGLLYLTLQGIKTIVFYKSAKMLQQTPSVFLLPLLEIVAPLFSLYVRIYRLFRGKNDFISQF